MKHIIVFMAFAVCIAMYSCLGEPEVNISNPSHLMQRSDAYLLFGGSNYIVLLKQHGSPEDFIYILRNNQENNLNQTLSLISITEIRDGWDVLQSNGTHLFFKINNNSFANYYGYSLVIASGPANYSRFYSNGLPRANPDIEAIKCGCKLNNSTNSCDAGGVGSTECSIEKSGGAFGNDLTEKCQVKCGEGHYSCCTK